MIVRTATTADANAIARLEQDAFGLDAWSPVAVEQELSGVDRFVVAALDDVDLVGYAVMTRSGDVADLLRIVVGRGHRRRGVARALLTRVVDEAVRSGVTRMLLEVSADNGDALAFYADQGFVEIDRRRRYYRDGTDALVMRRAVGRASCGGGG